MQPTNPEPGWYPDPEQPFNRLRYYNGKDWTSELAAHPLAAQQQQAPTAYPAQPHYQQPLPTAGQFASQPGRPYPAQSSVPLANPVGGKKKSGSVWKIVLPIVLVVLAFLTLVFILLGNALSSSFNTNAKEESDPLPTHRSDFLGDEIFKDWRDQRNDLIQQRKAEQSSEEKDES